MIEIIYLFVLFIIASIVLFFGYIKLKYKFWSCQPVFHFYDFHYWMKNVGIINQELPQKNKFTNLKNVKTISSNKITETNWKDILILIQINYLRDKHNIYFPKLKNIQPYFSGHKYDSFWSFYLIDDPLYNSKTGSIINNKKSIGIISSRPLQCFLNDEIFFIYYVDYLCVDKNYRNKGIAPQIIQTHEYNQSHSNLNISVSLFKREEELTGIIPLTCYNTYCYNLSDFLYIDDAYLEPHIKLLTGDNQNIYYFYKFLQENQLIEIEIEKENNADQNKNKNKNKKWDIMIIPSIGNLCNLIDTKNIYVKMLMDDRDIIACYIFKKSCTYLEKNKQVISCIGSVKTKELTNDEFIDGFKICLYSIISKELNENYNYLSIENISDNNIIINNFHELFFSPTAYFFYNFAYSPFKSNKCFIIN